MDFRTILFDMDGTLVDTELYAADLVDQYFQQMNQPISREDRMYLTGRPWQTTFQYLLERYPIQLPAQEVAQSLMQQYRQYLHQGVRAVPGSVQAVQSLASEFTLGLVSGSCHDDIVKILQQLNILKYFQVILGFEDYPRGKPHPDGYLKALDLLNAHPQSTLVFEDSTVGIASARQAGLWVVAIESTNHFQQDQSQAHAKIWDFQDWDAERLRQWTKTWMK